MPAAFLEAQDNRHSEGVSQTWACADEGVRWERHDVKQRKLSLPKHLYDTVPTCSSTAPTDQPSAENLLHFRHLVLFVRDSCHHI